MRGTAVQACCHSLSFRHDLTTPSHGPWMPPLVSISPTLRRVVCIAVSVPALVRITDPCMLCFAIVVLSACRCPTSLVCFAIVVLSACRCPTSLVHAQHHSGMKVNRPLHPRCPPTIRAEGQFAPLLCHTSAASECESENARRSPSQLGQSQARLGPLRLHATPSQSVDVVGARQAWRAHGRT